MTREEAIAYLKELHQVPDLCYACGQCGGLYDCKLEQVIEYLEKPRSERLMDILREVRGEK